MIENGEEEYSVIRWLYMRWQNPTVFRLTYEPCQKRVLGKSDWGGGYAARGRSNSWKWGRGGRVSHAVTRLPRYISLIKRLRTKNWMGSKKKLEFKLPPPYFLLSPAMTLWPIRYSLVLYIDILYRFLRTMQIKNKIMNEFTLTFC